MWCKIIDWHILVKLNMLDDLFNYKAFIYKIMYKPLATDLNLFSLFQNWGIFSSISLDNELPKTISSFHFAKNQNITLNKILLVRGSVCY